MPNRSQLADLAFLRLEEADALHHSGHHDGCVYLCGYAVEMALKAIICRHLDVIEYPRQSHFKVHDFDALLLFAGLSREVLLLSATQKTNWELLTTWNSAFRYNPRNSYNQQQARDWLQALRDPHEGVLSWLQTKW